MRAKDVPVHREQRRGVRPDAEPLGDAAERRSRVYVDLPSDDLDAHRLDCFRSPVMRARHNDRDPGSNRDDDADDNDAPHGSDGNGRRASGWRAVC